MPSECYELVFEPRDEEYRQFILEIGQLSKQASLIVRKDDVRTPAINRALELLAPSLISERTVTEWPGTILYWDGTAQLYLYDLSEHAKRVIQESANSLFCWQYPDLPEDLAFYDESGEVVLETIAHEYDARVFLPLGAFHASSNFLKRLLNPLAG